MTEYRCVTCGEPVPGPGEEHGKCLRKRYDLSRAAQEMADRHEREALWWIMGEARFPSGETERHWSRGFPGPK